ncbi:unnamed protein product [Linum trigynum]|uniref:Uncharacterized protein n=1 Tax=Linum trigynum TaxID=586398 RepID=A0AAV2CD57_9ROSI
MSRRSDSGAPSSDATKDTGSAPDVLSVLAKYFSPDPLRESGGWTSCAKNQAPTKDDATIAAVTLDAPEALSIKEPLVEAQEPPSSQAPATDVAPNVAAPSNPTLSKWL